jgi:hypothetical protein
LKELLFSQTSLTPSPRESGTKLLPMDIMGVCENKILSPVQVLLLKLITVKQNHTHLVVPFIVIETSFDNNHLVYSQQRQPII